MRRVTLTTLIVGVVFLFCLFGAFGAQAYSAIINEIAWMGTDTSSNDEWIELSNTTDEEIDLAGWSVAWGETTVELSGTIPAQGMYLLERTDDSSVPDVTANQIYTGALNNIGEDMYLYDIDNILVDAVLFASGWSAGDNDTKQTMERVCPLQDGSFIVAWQDSSQAGGTPGEQNGGCAVDCIPQEIARWCAADGLASVTYSYQNSLCGSEYQELILDQSCSCQYTEWIPGECVSDVSRAYSRTEISGYDYCKEVMYQELTDELCGDENKDMFQSTGRLCLLEGFHWNCDIGTLHITESDILFKRASETIRSFSRTQMFERNLFTTYVASNEWQKLIVIVGGNGNFVMGRAPGLWFNGK